MIFHITPDEAGDLMALGDTAEVLGDLFTEGDGTVEAIHMCAATLRRGADVLEGIAKRYEAN